MRALRWIAPLIALSLALPACRRRVESPGPGTSEAPVKILYPAAPGSFAKTVAQLKPSVVQLVTSVPVKGGPGDWFPAAGPGEGTPLAEPSEKLRRSLGTGFVVDVTGTILTNAHVVGKDREVRVRFDDGREERASVVGQDLHSDLAVLKVEPRAGLRLVPVRFGDSEALQVGEWVAAIGNPFGFGPTISVGVISAKERRDMPLGQAGNWGFLQTDAAINAGNSGGPLVNVIGEVVGLNTAVSSEGTSGIGFAVPARTVLRIAPMLKRDGKVVRTWVGIYMDKVTQEVAARVGLKQPSGALITGVVPRGPAERAGLRVGDVILSFDNRDVQSSADLPWIASLAGVDRLVPIKVLRAGATQSFWLRTERMPE